MTSYWSSSILILRYLRVTFFYDVQWKSVQEDVPCPLQTTPACVPVSMYAHIPLSLCRLLCSSVFSLKCFWWHREEKGYFDSLGGTTFQVQDYFEVFALKRRIILRELYCVYYTIEQNELSARQSLWAPENTSALYFLGAKGDSCR